MSRRRTSTALAVVAGLAGCAPQTLEDHAGRTPVLDLRDYLNGTLTATGIYFDAAGRADLGFVVAMEGTWEGNTGRLTERFTYDDGRTDERVWTIRFASEGHFTATAHDVVGEAEGRQLGNAARMNYSLVIPRGEGEITLSMEDWLYLQRDGTLINRTKMRKFGLPVGELIVTFRKVSK